MLVDQARLVVDREPVAMPLLEGQRLVEREAELARDHVDPPDSRLASSAAVFSIALTVIRSKAGRLAPPGRVGLEDDAAAGRDSVIR